VSDATAVVEGLDRQHRIEDEGLGADLLSSTLNFISQRSLMDLKSCRMFLADFKCERMWPYSQTIGHGIGTLSSGYIADCPTNILWYLVSGKQ